MKIRGWGGNKWKKHKYNTVDFILPPLTINRAKFFSCQLSRVYVCIVDVCAYASNNVVAENYWMLNENKKKKTLSRNDERYIASYTDRTHPNQIRIATNNNKLLRVQFKVSPARSHLSPHLLPSLPLPWPITGPSALKCRSREKKSFIFFPDCVIVLFSRSYTFFHIHSHFVYKFVMRCKQ